MAKAGFCIPKKLDPELEPVHAKAAHEHARAHLGCHRFFRCQRFSKVLATFSHVRAKTS
jgi:hypothetical protein